MLSKSKIPIKDKALYQGQEMQWTEEFTGNIELKKGDVLIHQSYNKIKNFKTKTTCFFHNSKQVFKNKELNYNNDDYISKQYVYIAILEQDLILPKYDDDEVRIDLLKHKDNISIYEAGESYNIKVSPSRRKTAYNLDLEFQNILNQNVKKDIKKVL